MCFKRALWEWFYKLNIILSELECLKNFSSESSCRWNCFTLCFLSSILLSTFHNWNFYIPLITKLTKSDLLVKSPTHWRSVLVSQLCPTLCNPMDCSRPVFSVLGILQAKILDWVAIPFSSDSSGPRDWTLGRLHCSKFFIIWATRKASWKNPPNWGSYSMKRYM